MLTITPDIEIPDHEIRMEAVRSQGPGGQHVNKVASAVHLRFDIAASSLPHAVKERLLKLSDRRVSKQGVIIIKAQAMKSREMNRQDALARLRDLISTALEAPKKRTPTRPSKASKEKRLRSKARRGRTKQLRGKVGRQES